MKIKWKMIKEGVRKAEHGDYVLSVIHMGNSNYLWDIEKENKIVRWGRMGTPVSAKERCQKALINVIRNNELVSK